MIDAPEFRYALTVLVIVLLLVAAWAFRAQFGVGSGLLRPMRIKRPPLGRADGKPL